MFYRVHAQFHEVRLDLCRAWLRRRERAVLRQLGRAVAASGASGEPGVGRLRSEIEGELARIEALAAESRTSLDSDRADVAVVAPWVRPIVVLRGLCVRLVIRHRQAAMRRALRPRYEAIGGLAAASGELRYPLEREVTALRVELARVVGDRERWVAPFGSSAFPGWTARARLETLDFGRAVRSQLRAHLLPKAPALAGLAVGWWVANTYTDSHLRSALGSIGIGSGGTRVVSSGAYDVMRFWLPLLAAALCAYAGERLRGFYRVEPNEVKRGDGR